MIFGHVAREKNLPANGLMQPPPDTLCALDGVRDPRPGTRRASASPVSTTCPETWISADLGENPWFRIVLRSTAIVRRVSAVTRTVTSPSSRLTTASVIPGRSSTATRTAWAQTLQSIP